MLSGKCGMEPLTPAEENNVAGLKIASKQDDGCVKSFFHPAQKKKKKKKKKRILCIIFISNLYFINAID